MADTESTVARLAREQIERELSETANEITLSVDDVKRMLEDYEMVEDPHLRAFLDKLGVATLCRDWLKLRARGATAAFAVVPNGANGHRTVYLSDAAASAAAGGTGEKEKRT